jgi:hypothetical protein
VIFATTLTATAGKSMTATAKSTAIPSQSIWFQQANRPATHDLSSGVCSITTEPSNNSIWFRDYQMQPRKAFPPPGSMCKLVPGKSNNSIWFKG